MASLRIGHGYDIHRTVAGRPLVLGGVRFEADFGLDGHSDADCLTHAICDALLGAAGLPDIGHFFPNTDPTFNEHRLSAAAADGGRRVARPRLAHRQRGRRHSSPSDPRSRRDWRR